jgi:Glu-tRNA(Gln) amidotransferase subunit E-like FAD-binding protein
MAEREPLLEVQRKQHPVASELGEVDVATQHEFLRDRVFNYQVFENEVCLVELDEEPPHNIDEEALRIGIEIALLLNCDIPDEIHVMRKTITDGSNTGAFQRTMIVGTNGWMKYGSKKIEITQIALEEDAAAIAGTEGSEVNYRLSRLGVPLVEITTGILEGFTPSQIQDIAHAIGLTIRSTGRVKHGIGSIRQDVNVSIKGGARCEIKGVQELSMLAKVVDKEIERQTEMIKAGKKVVNETRAANEDGTTKFNRPLPGAARMYPETDVVPISIDKKALKKIKASLPEPWTEKIARFEKKLKMPREIAMQIVTSDYLEIFEKIMKDYPKLNPIVAANVFTSTMKDLRRKNVDIGILEERHIMEIFDALAKKKIMKEAIDGLLVNFISYPNEKISDSLKKLNLVVLSKADLKQTIQNIIKANPDAPEGKVYGIVMSKVRGRADPQEVNKVVDSLMKRNRPKK